MMRYEKLLPHILDLAALDDAALDATALATATLAFSGWLKNQLTTVSGSCSER